MRKFSIFPLPAVFSKLPPRKLLNMARRSVLALFAAVLVPLAASAQEPIRFPRTPDISPDGKLVAFSYLGDIWTVETIGGVARPVAMHEPHQINPAFHPHRRR